MADISKCSGVGCKKKETCKRFTIVSDIIQSYFTEPPIQAKQKCDYWMPNGLTKESILKSKKRKISRGSNGKR